MRRAAKAAALLRAAVARLETLLSEAGIGSSEIGTIEALVKEVAQLRTIRAEPEGAEDIVGWHSAEARPDWASPEEARLRVTIKTLRKDITRLNREVGRGNRAIGEFHKKLDEEKERAESIRETAKELSRENLSLHRETRILGEQAVSNFVGAGLHAARRTPVERRVVSCHLTGDRLGLRDDRFVPAPRTEGALRGQDGAARGAGPC